MVSAMPYAIRNAMNSPTVPAIVMDASGRLVLPKALRDQLQLKAGAKLRAEVVGGRIELTPEDDDCELVEKNGLWVIRSKNPDATKFDAAAELKTSRQARIRKLAGRK